jgi:sporulation protein YlmC with PRC-barrel domain
MLKQLMASAAITGLMIGAAVAQSTPQSTTPQSTMPGTSAPAAGTTHFINTQSSNQWLSSSFIGTDVMGPDDTKIGDVSDILFDKDGKVVAYVVGVGGFLGIGAKDVAIAPSSFQVAPAATTGSGTTAMTRSDEVKLRLNMTKDQLQQAASFESSRSQDAKTRSAPPTGGNAPR